MSFLSINSPAESFEVFFSFTIVAPFLFEFSKRSIPIMEIATKILGRRFTSFHINLDSIGNNNLMESQHIFRRKGGILDIIAIHFPTLTENWIIVFVCTDCHSITTRPATAENKNFFTGFNSFCHVAVFDKSNTTVGKNIRVINRTLFHIAFSFQNIS